MGTQKQADTIVSLISKIRARSNRPPLTLDERSRARAMVLDMTLEQVRAEFRKLNELLGFDRKTSAATDKQLAVLRRLEREAYGKATSGFDSGLTYDEASARIALLLEQKHSRRAAS